MGTRSLTTITEDGKPLVKIYRQYDGYPEGHGRDLLDILRGREMVNGIPGGANGAKLFNGTGCMAAQIIRKLKTEEAGGIYIAPLDDDGGCCDYRYTIETTTSPGGGWSYTVSAPRLTVDGYGDQLFAGSVEEFAAWLENDGDDGDGDAVGA